MGKEGIMYLRVRKIENGIVFQSKTQRVWLSDILDQYNEQQVRNCLKADGIKRTGSECIFKAMSDHNISQETYDMLGKLHDEICDPANKGNWPMRININYV